MATKTTPPKKISKYGQEEGLLGTALRLGLLALIDAFVIWLVLNLINNSSWPLAIAVLLTGIGINIVLLKDTFYPVRWMLPGLILLVLFSIYPIIFTVYVAFTNFSQSNLLSKDQAIEQIEKKMFLPEGAEKYRFVAFAEGEKPDGELAKLLFWLIDDAGNSFVGRQDQPLVASGDAELTLGELDSKGVPASIEGYTKLNAISLSAQYKGLDQLVFVGTENAIQIRSVTEAAAMQPQYKYDEKRDVMIDQVTNVEYVNRQGTFTAKDQSTLTPGFKSFVGLGNFTEFFSSSAFAGPLLRIVLWNFAFAGLSVLMTFALGLAIAILYQDKTFPGRKIIQSFLLIPYTIPSLITILIWRGLFNPQFGAVSQFFENLFGIPGVEWTTDQWWAKAAILLVNLWLGYPYFMLITSGALQSIPSDIYEAASIDGASAWAQFRKLTLPLLLVSVGPLLLASFTFNFNNFNLIYLFIEGGPPIANSALPAGHTDILISYVYGLAFAGGRGADYGLASAITIIIFFIVAAITLFQFRYTKMWEEVGEGV